MNRRKERAQTLRSRLFRIPKAVLIAILALHLAYIGITSLALLVYRVANPPGTVLMLYRRISSGWKIQKPIPLKLREIPLLVRRMLISVEDGKFYEHKGFDMEAIRRAQELNKKLGRPMYGGSTISMQVARTLFLVPEKSYLRKYLEAIATFELELILPKDRILELYFGYAEWGRGIFGIERASRVYYGTGVRNISADQAARLIALLSSPIKYNPDTLYRSLILRERYAYLVRKYVYPSEAVREDVEPVLPPGGFEPSADISSEGDIAAEEPSAGAREGVAPEAAGQGTAEAGGPEAGQGESAGGPQENEQKPGGL